MSGELCAGCGRRCWEIGAAALYVPATRDRVIPYVLCRVCARAEDREALLERVELRLGAPGGRA